MTIEKLIISEINKKGFVNISKFIELCQYGEEGYYIKKNPIGLKHDYITAPEISQMFGEILGLYIINYWQEKINRTFNLIELGPGQGTLIADIIRIASIKKNFIDSIQLSLIEINEHFIAKQKKRLKKLNFNKVHWQKEFNFKKNHKPSIIYSNEFFDCFPVRQFHKKEYWFEKFISYNNSERVFHFVSKKVQNRKLLKILENFNNEKVAEISTSRNKYFDTVCKFIKKNKGIFITIDYGYNIPPKNFSLQTIYNHKKTHLFENLGNQDITAHVNFGEFINIANSNNLEIEIFSTQKNFLTDYGIKFRKEKLQKNKNEKTINNIDLEYHRLIDKSQMGDIFKVLIVLYI